jgi:DNA replication protein DnaC
VIRGAPIGSRFEHCTLENFDHTRFNAAAHEACARLARGELEGVFLLGPVGVGKTHLLIGLMKAFEAHHAPVEEPGELVEVPRLRELVEQAAAGEVETAPVQLDSAERQHEPVVEFWPMLDLVSELRAEIKAGELELSRRCRTCDLLVIDDLGAERATDFVREELDRIVDWRYRDRRPIAVATNLGDREIVEKYGWRAISRWTESCERVRIEGPDYRTERS